MTEREFVAWLNSITFTNNKEADMRENTEWWKCPMCGCSNVADDTECKNCHRSAFTNKEGSMKTSQLAKVMGWPEQNSIPWHRECLANSRKHALRLTEEMNRLKAEIEKLDSENAFHLHQIRQAEKQGKTHFDADKFCQSRKKKCDRCGAVKPQGQSCGCFDNHAQ